MKILLATHNRHKIEEIRAIFAPIGVELLSVDDVPGLPEDVEEDADTFEGNALKKAGALCQASGLWTLADDSGLRVDALDGAPGVYSARFAGPECDTQKNNEKLLQLMKGKTNRNARFCCTIALCAPDGRHWTVNGICHGTILEVPRGKAGFGYDPLFRPEGYQTSFAELPPEEKNKISHRGRALTQAFAAWKDILMTC